jgi:hypothetical protein
MLSPRLVPTGLATGGCCRQWQIGCRPQLATSERHPIRVSGIQFYPGAGRKVAEVTTFGPELFPAFGLPPTLDDSPAPSPYRL